MATKFNLAQELKPVGVLAPAADAAGRTGRWVSARFGEKLTFVVYINQGVATTVALTVNQATSAAGAGSKAITGNARIWYVADVGTSDTLVRQSDATSFTTDAGVKEKYAVIEIDPATLDNVNGYGYVTVATGASSASNITSAMAYAGPSRYPGDGQPSLTT